MELREFALQSWQISNAVDKANQVLAFFVTDINTHTKLLGNKVGQPNLDFVDVKLVAKRSLHTIEGKCAMLHALTHIEFNAINLALDIIWRFEDMPQNFYLDWFKVAQEEAKHFLMLREYLNFYGYEYSSFSVHSGLMDMCEKTKDSLLARLAMVPRTLEARGLDMAPFIHQKLIDIKDIKGADILKIILHDELEHVLIGNKWFEYMCYQQNLNPINVFKDFTIKYNAPKPNKPVNQIGRKNAGFYEEEIRSLCEYLGIEYIL